MRDWFVAAWTDVAAVIVGTIAMYLSTLIAIRVAGRRTLARLSAFDVIPTVAIGTLLASTVVSKDPSYLQGLTALVTLLALQVLVGAVRQRSALMRKLVDFEPEVIAENGHERLRGHMLGAQLRARHRTTC